jgi:multidrug efflux pump subunit AcrB
MRLTVAPWRRARITEVREDIRSLQVIARSAGNARLDPSRITDFTLVGSAGQRIPLSQIGAMQVRMEDPILRRRDRTPTITVREDVAEGLQPPDVSAALSETLRPASSPTCRQAIGSRQAAPSRSPARPIAQWPRCSPS